MKKKRAKEIVSWFGRTMGNYIVGRYFEHKISIPIEDYVRYYSFTDIADAHKTLKLEVPEFIDHLNKKNKTVKKGATYAGRTR